MRSPNNLIQTMEEGGDILHAPLQILESIWKHFEIKHDRLLGIREAIFFINLFVVIILFSAGGFHSNQEIL